MDVHIELTGGDPPRGHLVRTDPDIAVPFVGWLGLISAIEQVIAAWIAERGVIDR